MLFIKVMHMTLYLKSSDLSKTLHNYSLLNATDTQDNLISMNLWQFWFLLTLMFIPAYRWKNIQAFTSNRSCIQLLTPTYSFHIKLTVKLIADKHFSSLSFMLYFYFAFQISLLQYHII